MLPKLRSDLIFAQRKDGTWNVFDPVHSRHFRVGPQEKDWLYSLNGSRTVEEIHKSIPRENAAQFFRLLGAYGLLQGAVVAKKKLFRRRYYIFSMRPSVLCEMPENTAITIRNGLFVFAIICLASLLALYLLMGTLSSLDQRALQSVPQFGVIEIPKIIFAILFISVVHESAHVVVARSFGVFVPRVGLMVLGFQPLFFADVSSMRSGATPWQKLLILIAGIAANIVLAMVALILSGVIGLQSNFIYYVASISFATAVFNMIPFFEYDGYHMLADCLEIPDLSRRAANLFRGGMRAPQPVILMYLIGVLAFRWAMSWIAASALVFTIFSMHASWTSFTCTWLLSLFFFGILTYLWTGERR